MEHEAVMFGKRPASAVGAKPDLPLKLGRQFRAGELAIRFFLFLCGFITIFTTIGIVLVLGRESWLLFQREYNGVRLTPLDLFTSTQWQPYRNQIGIWPLASATLMSSVIAMLVALPMGLGAAVYLSEYASQRVRNAIKPVLEVLAGVPTVVYGFFALQFTTPLLRTLIGAETVEIYNIASAGLVMGVMILPLVASMSEDALSAVPHTLREAAYGLGSTRLETTVRIVLPAAVSGIMAACILAISRAVGETMIMAVAAGARPNLTLNPFESAWTMTGYIASMSGGDLAYDTLDYNSIFVVGLLLFLMTLVLSILSRAFVARFREIYE